MMKIVGNAYSEPFRNLIRTSSLEDLAPYFTINSEDGRWLVGIKYSAYYWSMENVKPQERQMGLQLSLYRQRSLALNTMISSTATQ